ncbi:hypothetical protein F66182_8903 [Fusarium sp. NRRL 66182]|nr:hypothetical protein F66182_8903 [Fusarium sp. NRRL 66182]
MIPSLVLALAGAAAALEPRQVMHQARNQPPFIFSRDFSHETEPCKYLSQAYEESGTERGSQVFLAIPPSVGIACLKSVPLDKKRDLELLDYLEPLISFQSTLEILADPPKEYLFPGVDVLGGFETIRSRLENDKYETQYEVMTDLRSIFAAAYDGHFDYPPALLNAFLYARRGLMFESVSANGIRLPYIFHAIDTVRGNLDLLDYHPSAVKSIDGTPIFEWLEEDAARMTANLQDPDAQFNNLFASIPRAAAGLDGTAGITQFEIPDTYTIEFYNGSKLEVANEILVLPATDLSGIESGQDFHQSIEVTPTNSNTEEPSANERRSTQETESGTIVGYPEPVVKHSGSSMAGYFLAGEDYKDTAVLSILSFLPIGVDTSKPGPNFDMSKFILEGQAVILELIKHAKAAGRDKLIIDMSANGGGSVILAHSIYRLLFPDGEFTGWDRYRANHALEALSEADYDGLVKVLITKSNYPVGPDNTYLETGQDFYGPYTVKGQNVTAAFQTDKTVPWNPTIPAYINGFDPDRKPLVGEAPWKPENILIVTDGICASSCGILTGLLTRNHGIRTLALGGRPLNHAMQAMGGVKGTLLNYNWDLIRGISAIRANAHAKSDKQTLSILYDAEESLPSIHAPPLLPLPPGGGGSVNALNGYTEDDLEGYPVHFRYEAANCRLFYTQRMLASPVESWRRARGVAWNQERCVQGSTTNKDGTMGDKTVKYDSGVRSRARGFKGPGMLNK